MAWIDEVKLERDAVSPALLRVAMPNCPDHEQWAQELSDALEWGEVSDADEVSLFLAHVGHESSDLTRLEESLWYSAERLAQVWPRRYPTLKAAEPYAGNPEALANDTYGGRLGNTMPGDGWKYRGRGAIQLTGRYNYAECAKATGLPLITHPDRLAENPRYAALSAVWYWITRVTPGGDIRSTTIEVNGGAHGLADRKRRHDRITHFMNSAEA